VLTLASVKARSTGPKAGAPGLWRQHGGPGRRGREDDSVPVTPAFLALNKSPTKSCVFSKLTRRAQLPFKSQPLLSLSLPLSLSPMRVPRFPPAPHLGRTPPRLPNAAVGHRPGIPRTPRSRRPGIPRTPRSRRPVRLAITAGPKITPTPGKRKTPQNPSLISLTIFQIL
jgi:hypothetical protein